MKIAKVIRDGLPELGMVPWKACCKEDRNFDHFMASEDLAETTDTLKK